MVVVVVWSTKVMVEAAWVAEAASQQLTAAMWWSKAGCCRLPPVEDREESVSACGEGEEPELCWWLLVGWLPTALAHSEGGGSERKREEKGGEESGGWFGYVGF